MSALIYGGRSPIALALCRVLGNSGHEVHLITRNVDQSILRLAKENKCAEIHECDLEDQEKSIEIATKIDDLVNGLSALGFVHRYRNTKADRLKQFQVEVNTPYLILESLAKRTRSTQLSVMVTNSPASNKIVGDQDFNYHASKAALAQMVRFGAVQFARNNVRVNGVSPGSFIFKDRAADFYSKNPQIVERANQLIPLGRMGNVTEVAEVMAFVLSGGSSYITGQILEVDGGLSILDQAFLSKPI